MVFGFKIYCFIILPQFLRYEIIKKSIQNLHVKLTFLFFKISIQSNKNDNRNIKYFFIYRK